MTARTKKLQTWDANLNFEQATDEISKRLIKTARKAGSVPSIPTQRPCCCHLCGILPLVLPLFPPPLVSDLASTESLLKKTGQRASEEPLMQQTETGSALTSKVLFSWPWWVHTLHACFATWAHRQEMYLACKHSRENAGEGSSVELVWERKHQFRLSAVWSETSLICWWRWHTVLFCCFGETKTETHKRASSASGANNTPVSVILLIRFISSDTSEESQINWGHINDLVSTADRLIWLQDANY